MNTIQPKIDFLAAAFTRARILHSPPRPSKPPKRGESIPPQYQPYIFRRGHPPPGPRAPFGYPRPTLYSLAPGNLGRRTSGAAVGSKLNLKPLRLGGRPITLERRVSPARKVNNDKLGRLQKTAAVRRFPLSNIKVLPMKREDNCLLSRKIVAILNRGYESIRAVLASEENRFTRVLADLRRLSQEGGIPLAIVGGLAAIHYGYLAGTQDIDIGVARNQLEALMRAAPQYGFKVVWEAKAVRHTLTHGDMEINIVPEGGKTRDNSPTTIPGPVKLGVSTGARLCESPRMDRTQAQLRTPKGSSLCSGGYEEDGPPVPQSRP